MRIHSHRSVWLFDLFCRTNPLYLAKDIKTDNILASIAPPEQTRIADFVTEKSATVYGPPLELKSSNLPLFFSCSEPLPYFELGGTLEDISVRLVDYSEGGHWHYTCYSIVVSTTTLISCQQQHLFPSQSETISFNHPLSVLPKSRSSTHGRPPSTSGQLVVWYEASNTSLLLA
jgi:hypothetical protein